MTPELLKHINTIMDELKIPYQFLEWKSDIKFPFWVGEYSEIETLDEDGRNEFTFILTGTTNNNYLELLETANIIKSRFTNHYAILENGSGIVIWVSNTIPIPTEVENLYRIQVNLTIKEWSIG